MRIFGTSTTRENGAAVLAAKILPNPADAPLSLRYRFEGVDAAPSTFADPFAVAMLPSCMLDRERIRCEGALSPTLKQNLESAQRVLAGWYDQLSPVPVESGTPGADIDGPRADGVACCFSGGVDSWYSLLKHQADITHLLLVRGFDIGLGNDRLWQATRRSVEDIAERLGKRVIVCETNLRDIADRRRASWTRPVAWDFWGQCLHGAALSSCALALDRTIGRLIIPATHSRAQLKPWGSSPALDRHWSNGKVTVIHDGCEANRLDKVRAIARSDLALATLRVCHGDTAHANCGHCEKCLRTMIALRLCDALDRTASLPVAGAMSRLRRLEVPPHLMHHYEVLLAAARQEGDPAMSQSLEAIMGQRFSLERTAAKLVRRLRRHGVSLRARTGNRDDRSDGRRTADARP